MERYQLKFNIGDRVEVFQNTERKPRSARIGKRGVVLGYRMKDIEILFDDEKTSIDIIEDDLRLVE